MSGDDFYRGKVAAISGASSGLGALLAVEFARRGAALVLFARRREKLEAVAERCRKEQPAKNAPIVAIAGDVANPADCARFAKAAAQIGATNRARPADGGASALNGDSASNGASALDGASAPDGADFLICCAGASMWARFDAVADVAVFRKLMEINYLGVCHCVHFMLPQLRARRGMLVAVSSIQGKIGAPLHSGYCAAKHALQGLLASLRLELRGEVAVIGVLPHWIRGTELRANALADGNPPRAHGKDAVDAAVCAARIVAALPKKPREIYIPAKLRALPIIAALFPALADALVAGAVRRENARKD